jgi:hypothetical protein
MASFPDNFELLYDKNVWIFDTGASCNSSGCMNGAINIQDDNSEVIPANGVSIKQDKIGDILCSKLDKFFGNHANYTQLNSVKFGKQNTFNSFHAMAVNKRPLLEVHFFRGHISLKNWTICPLFSHDTSSFKDTCHLIYLIEAKVALYGPRLHC